MKCVFVTSVDVNAKKLSAVDLAKVKFRTNLVGGVLSSIPYFPAGTEYEHPLAHMFVRKGSATPGDEECRTACGMTEEQLAKAQHLYKRNAAGIRPEDWELFDHGVITGYTQDGEYIHGPAWDAYQESRKAQAKGLTASDI